VRKRLQKTTQPEPENESSTLSEHAEHDVQEAQLVQEAPAVKPRRTRGGSASPFLSRTSEQYLPAMFVRSSDAIITLDQDFFVRDVNPAACTTLGNTSSNIIDHRCPDVLGCRNLSHTQLCGTSSCPLTRVLREGPLPNEELLL